MDSCLPVVEDDLVVMGVVSAPYGIKGQIHVHNYNEIPVELIDISTWLLKCPNGWQPFKKLSAKLHNDTIVASLEGITDRDQAAAIKHRLIAVEKKDLPDAGEDTFYWYELTDMQVFNQQAEYLGRVSTLIRSPANDILQVIDEEGKERLIPVVATAIIEVDKSQRKIIVDWGLHWD